MAAQTWNARQTAQDVSKATGAKVTDKRVRAWVRENVEAYDDDGYTAHVYDAKTHATIVAGMSKGRKARSIAASTGRKATPSKPARKPSQTALVSTDTIETA